MKKLFIYYYVGGFSDTYWKIEVKDAIAKKMLFYESATGFYFFSRHNDSRIEKIFGHFNSKNDPLLSFVEEQRHSYFMEEIEND